MSTIKANNWQNINGVRYNPVIQVVQGIDTAYRTSSFVGNSTWVSATITRKLTTSKLLLNFTGCYGSGDGTDDDVRWYSSLDGYLAGAGGNSSASGSFFSNGTDNQGYGGSWTLRQVAGTYLYTPSNTTAAITITVYIYNEGTKTTYFNRDGWGGGGTQSHNTPAVLTITELDQ